MSAWAALKQLYFIDTLFLSPKETENLDIWKTENMDTLRNKDSNT